MSRRAATIAVGAAAGALWAAHRRMSTGPASSRAEFGRRAAVELARPRSDVVLTEEHLAHLPDPVAGYIRRSGALGMPMTSNFHARIHGRIRSGANSPWMPFAGEQVNTCTEVPSRLFIITASMKGLPVDVFHSFVGESATMRAKLLSIVRVVDASGPEMNRSETVTILNDICLMAPAALVDDAFEWHALDDRTAGVRYTRLAERVSATLHFDDDDRLVDFVSDDRFRSSSDGSKFTLQRWSTPVDRYRTLDGRRVMTYGEARWHAPEGEFSYLEFELDDISYDLDTM